MGSIDSSIRLLDIKTGKELHRFQGHTGTVWKVTYSSDGKTALSCSEDKTVRLWQLSVGSGNAKVSEVRRKSRACFLLTE